MKGVLIAFGVVAMLAMYGIGKNNEFIALDQQVDEKTAFVNTALQRRYDLIPALVNTVQGYAKHESAVFQAVTEARSKVGQFKVTPELVSNPEKMAEFQKAQGELSSALTRLIAVSENYPTLKADSLFVGLQAQLEGTENRIKIERDNFNVAVRTYNTAILQFPGSLFAGGRTKKQMFDVTTPDAQNMPSVKF